MHPYGVAVVDELKVVLNMALWAQHQSLSAATGGQLLKALGREVVQPTQAIRPADTNHRAVAEVDETEAVRELALFTQRVAVVGGDAGIDAPVDWDGTSQIEQRTTAALPVCSSYSLLGHSGHSRRQIWRAGSGFVREQVLAVGSLRVSEIPQERERKVLRKHVHRGVFEVCCRCYHALLIGITPRPLCSQGGDKSRASAPFHAQHSIRHPTLDRRQMGLPRAHTLVILDVHERG